MPKDSTIKKLRLILDNRPNSKKISEEDKKYINALKNRLKKQNQEIYYKRSRSSTTEKESLKPKVTVYPRKEHKKKLSETKTETSKGKTKIKIEGEELFEIEKTTDEPYFIEIKPKKLRKKEELTEWRAVDKEKKQVKSKEKMPEDEMTEWEPLDKENEIATWETVEEKEPETVEVEPIRDEDKLTEKKEDEENINIEIFEDVDSVDDKTAMLLLKNGYADIESLKKASYKELSKIKGIKRKKAKEIIKDLQEDAEWEIIDEPSEPVKKEKSKSKPLKNKVTKFFKRKKEKKSTGKKEEIKEDISDDDFYMDKNGKTLKKTPKKSKKQGYTYKKYTLYEKKVTTKKGNKRTIRFFSKEKPDDSKPIKLPKGYKVKENKKTGVPYIKKKSK